MRLEKLEDKTVTWIAVGNVKAKVTRDAWETTLEPEVADRLILAQLKHLESVMGADVAALMAETARSRAAAAMLAASWATQCRSIKKADMVLIAHDTTPYVITSEPEKGGKVEWRASKFNGPGKLNGPPHVMVAPNAYPGRRLPVPIVAWCSIESGTIACAPVTEGLPDGMDARIEGLKEAFAQHVALEKQKGALEAAAAEVVKDPQGELQALANAHGR